MKFTVVLHYLLSLAEKQNISRNGKDSNMIAFHADHRVMVVDIWEHMIRNRSGSESENFIVFQSPPQS